MIKKWLQIKLIDWLIHDIYNGVKKEDILKVKKGQGVKKIYYKDKELKSDKAMRIIESADKFEESDIWKILKSEVRFQLKKRMYENSKTEYDLVAGKMGLYIINLIEDKIKEIKN